MSPVKGHVSLKRGQIIAKLRQRKKSWSKYHGKIRTSPFLTMSQKVCTGKLNVQLSYWAESGIHWETQVPQQGGRKA